MPILFALSNPTKNAECTAKQAYAWTNGRCIFASGSPFDPVTINGKTYEVSQLNNMFIFPGLGYGTWLAQAEHVTDKMILEASKALASCVDDDAIARRDIIPNVNDIRSISAKIAATVILAAVDEGVSTYEKEPIEQLIRRVRESMYEPHYL